MDMDRRAFTGMAASAALALTVPDVASGQAPSGAPGTLRLRPGGSDDGFDPWLEIIGDSFRHNAREVARLAGGRPILAVVKNNAYGIGDMLVGPLLDQRARRWAASPACGRPRHWRCGRRA